MSNDHPWSFSQLSTYLRCPLQHFFRYVLGIPERTVPAALALGSAVHEALAAYHRSLQEGQPIHREAINARFHQAWEERKAQELIVYTHGNEQGAIDQGVALLETYQEGPPPQNIQAVEHRITLPVVNSQGEILDKQLVALIDLLTRNDAQALTITEIKTSSRTYSDMEAQLSLQATLYLMAVQGVYQEAATFRYQVLIKTKTPRTQQIDTARTPNDFNRAADLIEAVDRAVEAGIHYPVENPFNCSTCPYRRPCRDWQGHQTLPLPEGRIPLSLAEGNRDVG